MSEQAGPAPGETLEALCRQVASLTTATAGPLRRIRLRVGDASVEVEWPETAVPSGAAGQPAATGANGAAATASAASAASAVPASPASAPPAAEPDGRHYVCSPLVGTFYRASTPGAAPFVTTGDVVEAGQQVGIIEAMKLMNAVEADRGGVVVEVLATDAMPVEYEQPLIVLIAEG